MKRCHRHIKPRECQCEKSRCIPGSAAERTRWQNAGKYHHWSEKVYSMWQAGSAPPVNCPSPPPLCHPAGPGPPDPAVQSPDIAETANTRPPPSAVPACRCRESRLFVSQSALPDRLQKRRINDFLQIKNGCHRM